MTNDEAIYVLKNTAWLGWDKQKEKVTEAVRMAVEALKRETSGDAISREAVSAWLKQYGQDVLHGKYKFSLMYIWKNIMELPSVQPVDKDINVSCNDAISRHGAIDICNNVIDLWQGQLGEGALVAIKNAINNLPSVQPERTEERTETHACDCVSRQAAIDAISCDITVTGRQNAELVAATIGTFADRIKALPPVQPTYTEAEVQKIQELEQAQLDKAFELGKKSAKAEIIHCGECKHWREGTAFSYCDKLHGMGVLDALDYMTAEDDYCSMAEREDDGF